MQDDQTTFLTKLVRGLGVLALLIAVAAVLVSRSQMLSAARPASVHSRIPVYYWHMWSGEWQPVMERVVAEFNASQSKYQVIPLQVPYASADSKFLMSVAGGSPPDVMAQWTNAVSTWSQDGVLQPLDTRMTGAEKDFFLHGTYPVFHQNGWYKGHLYGMVAAADVYACYYRPDQFRRAGLDPSRFPSTLEALTAAGRKMDLTDGAGSYTQLGFLPQSFQNYVAAFGGGFYDTKTGQVLLNTPANLRALSYIVDTSRQLGLDRVRRFSAGLKSQNGASWPFIDGSFSVALDGEWRVLQLAQYAPTLDYQVAPLPPPAGGKPLASFAMTDYLTIPAGAKHAEGAWEFIKFWTGLDHPERAAKYKVWFGWLPSSPRMAQSPDYQTFLRKYPKYKTFVRLAASPNIASTPPVPYQLFLMDRITTVDDLASRGALTPAQALAKLERDTATEQARRKGLGYDQ